MSVKSYPSTGCQADSSNISETTIREHKGQNRTVINWLRLVEPDRDFLRFGERVWTYGETLHEVETRLSRVVAVLSPRLDPDSVFDVLAGMSGGGAIVKPGRHGTVPETTEPLVVFTSGSTGEPKGVRLTSGNLEAAAAASMEHLRHDETDTWLLAMPLHHVGGLSILVRQMYSGGSVRLLPVFDPESFADAMKHDVTMVSVVPTMLHRLLSLGPFSGLRAVLVGGGPIPPGLLEEARAVGLPVLPTYGMTETFGQVATLRPDAPLAYSAHPLPGVDIAITDGHVAVRGPQVFRGYLGEPDREDPWFVTNDLGEIDADGALRILGRADTVIVTGGENVSPERLEAVVTSNPSVDSAVVVGIPDPEWGHSVSCAYVGEVLPAQLREWMAERTEAFMVPKRFIKVDDIPLTAIGKPDRMAVSQLFQV